MKKSLLTPMLCALMALFGVSTAWAQTTTLLEYGTNDVAWTADNLAEWTAGGTPTITDGYVAITGKNGSYATSKTIEPTANAIINVSAVWRGRSNTGRAFSAGNGSYFRFGNIVVAQNDQDKKHGYTFSGLDNMNGVTTFTAGSYRVEIEDLSFLLIEMEINTASNTVTSFAVKSEDGATTYASAEDVVLSNADYTTVAFGYRKSGSVSTANAEHLKSVKITQTTQAVETATYTVKFVCNGTEIKDAEERSGVVGQSIALNAADTQNFFTADNAKKYIFVSSDVEGKTIAADGSSVVTVTFREAEKYAWTAKSSVGTYTTSGETWEGEKASVPYPLYQLVEGKLWTKAATDKVFAQNFDVTANNQEFTLDYTATDIEAMFLAEVEDIQGMTAYAAGNAAARSSQRAAGYSANGKTAITTLAPGKYKLVASFYSPTSAGGRYSFFAGNRVIWNTTTENSNATNGEKEIVLTKEMAIELGQGSYTSAVDYIYIQSLGEATAEEIAAADAEEALANAKAELQAAIDAAKAIDTTDKEGVDALNAAISAAETALNAADATVESVNAAKAALAQAVAAFEEANKFNPAYGEIWSGDVVFPTEGYDVIALSTAYFKDFVKAGDQLVVTLVPKNDEARAEAPRRTIDLGSLALLASDQQTVIAEDDQIEGDADEVVIDIEESWIEQLSTGDFVYLRGQNLRVTKVELLDGTPAEDSELMKEAKELAQDEDAVAVGKLIAAIAEAAETGDESGLQDAIDQFKQDNADQENDQTAKVATNGWKKFDGSAAGVCATQFAPAITTYDGRTAQLAEVYESSVDRTGTIIYQDIAGLENGSYKVGFYGNAFYTSGRGFDSPMAEGAEDVAYVFANDQKAFITAHIATETTENDFREFDVEVTDGTIKLGMGKEQAGTNWHTMQIYRLTWFTTAKEVFAKDQQDLATVIAEATALATDGSEGLDELNDAIAAAQLAVNSNWYNIEEVEQIIAELKDAIKAFKNANLIVPEGKYYVLNAYYEDELFMAAGSNWGTKAIANTTGLDLNFIYNEAADAYNIDTDIYNGDNHFLGSNLYMDAPAFNWTIEGEFTYTISAVFDGVKKYIGANEDGTITLRDTETDDTQWAFIKADFMDNLRLEEGLEAMKGAKEDNPVDATFLLKDADFNRNDHRWVAWTVSDDCTNKNLGGGCSEENGNGCAESYRSTFEISQVVANAPAGTYQLTAQGFYRQENGSTDPAPVFFMNDKTAEVPAITGSENDMNQAGISFSAGSYTIEPIETKIEDGETLTVGIKNTSNSQWVIWDNFRLTYLGAAATGISEVASDVLATGNEVYNLQGQKVQRAQKGLFIVNGKKVVVK